VAAKAIGQESCSYIQKIAEGRFHKIFLIGTDDGFEVIARISIPIAGPPRYTRASEVATINFF
jgi:hypothetical protein